MYITRMLKPEVDELSQPRAVLNKCITDLVSFPDKIEDGNGLC